MAYKINTIQKIKNAPTTDVHKIIVNDFTKACKIAKINIDDIDVDFHFFSKNETAIKIITNDTITKNQMWYVKNLITDSFLQLKKCGKTIDGSTKITYTIKYKLPQLF